MLVINFLLYCAGHARGARMEQSSKKWWQTFQKTDTYANLALVYLVLKVLAWEICNIEL